MQTDDTSALPKRLKQLRLELGWSLDDVARAIEAASKGVVSNWEAPGDRRRTPPLGTLMALARWYGVSLDYLMGVRGAERDSPQVRLGKAALKERFPAEVKKLPLLEASPAARFRLALAILQEVAPEAFFAARVAANIGLTESQLGSILDGGTPADATLDLFARFADLPRPWFYMRPEDI